MDAEHKNPGHENVDRWLDAALRTRVGAEPRMGLEDRVLAKLATEKPRTTFAWIPVLAAATAVIAVSAALIVTYSSRRSGPIAVVAPPIVQNTRISEAPIQGSNTTPDAQHSGKTTVRGIARIRAPEVLPATDHEQALPGLATFPAPSPETAQERMLARIAARHSSFDLANASPDLVPLKDLSVPELKIEPMEGTPPDNIPQE